MSFIITYDLNKTGQNYKNLEDAIKSYGTWAKITTTTYTIVTNSSAVDVRNYLQKYIDSNDELFVAKLSGEAAWTGLGTDQANWLTKNLSR